MKTITHQSTGDTMTNFANDIETTIAAIATLTRRADELVAAQS